MKALSPWFSWGLSMLGVLLIAACGGARVDAHRGTDSGVPGDAGEPFTVEVLGGYGSGTYRAGTTVHVWSAASTPGEVALPWEGDADLLAEPLAWHSSFVMPARDVRLVSGSAPQSLALTVETFNGSTSRPKTVRYFFPPGMRGVALFSHGTGGSNTFIEGRGVPTDYLEHPASPLYDERFSRIAGISLETSRTMAAELRAAGLVNSEGFFNRDGDAIGVFVMMNPRQFPTLVAQTESLGAIRSKVKVMRAEHAMYADYTQRNVAWFDRFNPRP